MPNCSPSADRPLVSAIIPTHRRPGLLACAVRSALRQTWPNLEVIVVVDGCDSATESLLDGFADPRLRVLLLPEPAGGAAARNAGVHAARGEWVAFLDDDDEWMPRKIERQMAAVRATSAWFPVISCRVVAQSPAAGRVLPLRVYQPSQPVADYLFCRTTLADPGGLMQTSTLLAPRDLLLALPFNERLPLHQDWDWLIRVASCQGVAVSMLSEPLAIWRVEDARATVGRNTDWQASLAWIREMKPIISPRAWSWFIAVQCAWRAQSSRASLPDRARLLWAYLFQGRPEWRSFLHSLVFACLPAGLRRTIRNRIWRNPARVSAAPALQLVFARNPAPAALRRSAH